MADFPTTRASLLVRLRDARDAQAWADFVDLYAPLVYGYALKQGLQDADASDLCQEVLRAVAGAAGRFDYDPRLGRFRNWLFTLVRRKLANLRQRRIVRGSGDDATKQLLEQIPSSNGADDDAEWERDWQRRIFEWACEQARRDVNDRTWRAFWATAVDGRSGKDVARELGITVAAVYLARGRVTARLKELVASQQCE
jgi:RNA polymerase sigma factor (sigma-70 family)